jgi:multidrug efflux pump subunit AcrA (membrane-fusion protein)
VWLASLGITSVTVFFLFNLATPMFAQNTILTPGLSSKPALAEVQRESARANLTGMQSAMMKSQARAEVSQQISELDKPVVEDVKLAGETGDKKKFLGSLFLYMLLKSQER